MIVWGGVASAGAQNSMSDGAAYDPRQDSWRILPRSPLAGRAGATGSWTGKELLIFGGGNGQAMYADGAAFDPRKRSWRVIAAMPLMPGLRLTFTTAIYADGQLLVWSTSQGTQGTYGELYSYSPDTNLWSLIPPSAAALPAVYQVVSGTDMVYVRGAPFVCGFLCPWSPPITASFDPTSKVWTRVPTDPLEYGGGSLTWTGAAIFELNETAVGTGAPIGGADTYDPISHTWFRLPTAPFVCSGDSPVWTDFGAIVLCSWMAPGTPSTAAGLDFEVP
jgi:hypothetical protein